jgi:hypothetical protein
MMAKATLFFCPNSPYKDDRHTWVPNHNGSDITAARDCIHCDAIIVYRKGYMMVVDKNDPDWVER